MINPAQGELFDSAYHGWCVSWQAISHVRLFLAEQGQHRLLLAGLVGLLIGLAVNFRLP